MSDFITLVTSNGLTGLIVGLAVLVAVYGMSAANITVTGNQKRIANVVLSILISGVSLVNPESADVVVGAIATVSSALVYEFIQYLLAKKNAKAEAK